jgi:hypothetical protein
VVHHPPSPIVSSSLKPLVASSSSRYLKRRQCSGKLLSPEDSSAGTLSWSLSSLLVLTSETMRPFAPLPVAASAGLRPQDVVGSVPMQCGEQDGRVAVHTACCGASPPLTCGQLSAGFLPLGGRRGFGRDCQKHPMRVAARRRRVSAQLPEVPSLRAARSTIMQHRSRSYATCLCWLVCMILRPGPGVTADSAVRTEH